MEITFYFLLPIIAFLYATVGHGGASGYLALMGIYAFTPEEMRPTALMLNLFVAGIAFIHFYRSGFFKPKTFIYFASASIPMAFLGGTMQLDASIYKLILGLFLLISVAKMSGILNLIFTKQNYDTESKTAQLPIGILAGGAIGLFSGLIGIGGGIILSPVILLLRWGTTKEAAAVSALFIWVNSFAGLIGTYSKDGLVLNQYWKLMVVLVIIGGFIGGFIGSKKLNNKILRYLLCFLLLTAAIKLIFKL